MMIGARRRRAELDEIETSAATSGSACFARLLASAELSPLFAACNAFELLLFFGFGETIHFYWELEFRLLVGISVSFCIITNNTSHYLGCLYLFWKRFVREKNTAIIITQTNGSVLGFN